MSLDLLLWSSPADGGYVERAFAVRVIVSFNSALKCFGSLSPALKICYRLDSCVSSDEDVKLNSMRYERV